MAFHFPLMPRLFMALAQEDRQPLVDIMSRTRDIPAGCQWALFLRNHDELTLEMISDEERNHLWHVYATHRRLRINLGIRRRLAPLLRGDRRRIELMNSLLFSLPGTPVVYYGDEIGMGDNPFLGDRDGVRTPMQWSADRNAGFSRADELALYLPPVRSALYGYESVNVETQRARRSSLLNWMRWIMRVRNAHRAFGRGETTFLNPENRRVLAYIRALDEEIILCAVNLSETAQAVQLDLSAYCGRTPVSLFGGGLFPAIGESMYQLTFAGHSFYWLKLLSAEEARQRERHPQERTDQPDLPSAAPPPYRDRRAF
jgi:maltose alpha-D-glucosyltransferase/alpha-amylase